MSARQLNRLAKAKGKDIDPLLPRAFNEEYVEESEEESEEEPELSLVSAAAAAFGDDSSDEGSSEDDSDTATDDGGDVDDMSTSAESVERAERSGGDDDHTNPRSSLEDGPPLLLNSGEDGTGDNLQQQPQSVDDELVLSPCKTRTAGETLDTSTYGAAASTSSGAPESLATSIRTRRPRAPPQTTSEKRTAVAVASRTPIAAPAAPPEEAKYQDDHEYLDSIIAELQLRNTGNIDGGGDTSEKDTMVGTLSPLAQLLRCDVRCLKLENELRRKFGSSVRPGGGGAGAAGGDGDVGGAGRARRRRGLMPRGGGNNASGASLALKRLVVSAPKDDWPKPPSLVGGGLGMSRCEEGAPEYLPAWQVKAHQGAEWFVFERSESLQQMQGRFEAIQGMHDPNLLAAFASQVPYHADALLQLAMVFAHTGQMDRASEFVGRALYVLESACTDGFRPAEGASRVDASLEVNKTYMAAMFRHMQMAGMMGGARTALEVGRLLLSLDPLGDPMGCLLALDTHALASRQGQFLVELYNSRLPIGWSPSMLAHFTGDRAEFDVRPDVTVQDLPGLSVSVGLAILDTSGDISAARDAMASALLRFPVMLEPLLEKCGLSPRSTSYPQNWKSVMQHVHFGQAAVRLPRGHVLLHLASIFAARGGEIWKHERAQELLYDGAGIALQGLVTAQYSSGDRMLLSSPAVAPTATTTEHTRTPSQQRGSIDGTESLTPTTTTEDPARNKESTDINATNTDQTNAVPMMSELEMDVLARAYNSRSSPIHKYLDLAVSDFVEEGFALLPQDANILDPRLMGPNFMNERVRFRLPAGPAAGGGGGGLGGVGLGAGLDELLAMALDLGHGDRRAVAMRGMGDGVGGRRQQQGGPRRGNLDPRAPLLQLFWQSLLPWNVFPTLSRPVPRPPPWL